MQHMCNPQLFTPFMAWAWVSFSIWRATYAQQHIVGFLISQRNNYYHFQLQL
jgi:hypothetical protein